MSPSDKDQKQCPAVSPAATGGNPCAAAAVFDRNAFLDRIMEDEELAHRIIETFLAEVPTQIGELGASVAAGDCGLAQGLAHRIKGVAANLGAESLREVASEMEKAGKDGDREALTRRLPELRECFARLRVVLEGEIERGA